MFRCCNRLCLFTITIQYKGLQNTTIALAVLDPLAFDELNIDADFDSICNYFERFELFCELKTKLKVDLRGKFLLLSIGAKAYAVIKILLAPNLPALVSYYENKTALLEHVKSVSYEIQERAEFHQMRLDSQQYVKDFVLQLREKANRCNFGKELPERLRDQFVAGTRNLDSKATLLMLPDLTFQAAVRMCKELEWSNQFLKRAYDPGVSNARTLGACNSCGERHLRSKCAVRNAVCEVCGRRGHISNVCKDGEQRQPNSAHASRNCALVLATHAGSSTAAPERSNSAKGPHIHAFIKLRADFDSARKKLQKLDAQLHQQIRELQRQVDDLRNDRSRIKTTSRRIAVGKKPATVDALPGNLQFTPDSYGDKSDSTSRRTDINSFSRGGCDDL